MVDLKDRFTRFIDEVFLTGNISMIDRYIAPTYVEHEDFGPGTEDWSPKEFVQAMHTAFSNIRYDVKDIAVEGNKVWARSVFSGTHTGEFFGMPPTHRSFEVASFDCVRFEGDLAVEHWGITDTLTMMTQLGAPPATPTP